jgi:NAD(P)H-flavin reductase
MTPFQPMLPSLARVRSRIRETHDTFSLVLEPAAPDGSDRPVVEWPLAGFRPGQFNMLYVYGVGEVPISLSGDAASSGRLVHTIRAVGSVTNALAKLRRGDVVGIRGPFGSSWPADELAGNDVVIVTGGIGLAPLRPVIYYLLGHRKKVGRICLLYGSRTPSDLLYAKELERWPRRMDCQVLISVDRADDSWTGHVGVVTTLFAESQFDPAKAVGLICGPEVMMRFTIREFQKRGVPDDRLYVSLERNMQCAIGFCGHCQFGPNFVCMNGPVFRYDRVKDFFAIREA